MKYYVLSGKLAGESVKFAKQFKSRNEALDFAFKYSRKKYVFGLEVEEILEINNDKHNIQYICNKDTSFIINRVVY